MKQLDYYETIEKIKHINNESILYLMLCNISHENLGLIMRSAEIFGANKIFCIGEKTEDFQKSKKISRNSSIEVEYVKDSNILQNLKEQGFSIIALEITDTAKPLQQIVFGEKTCLVVGNEQHGIPQEILNKCDESYYIEMISKNITSLNVAIATSIALNRYLETR